MQKKQVDLSIVIPVFNEEKNIQPLYRELLHALQHIGRKFEIVFVDDGSTDGGFQLLGAIAKKDKRVRIVRLLRNSGQGSAIGAGIENSSGATIITMDADLQNDPAEIPDFLRKIDAGYDVVCGWRQQRAAEAGYFKKTVPSRLANALAKRMMGLNVHDATGCFRAFNRRVFERVSVYGELHRYVPYIAFAYGFKVGETPITIRKRRFGKGKYGAMRLFRGFFDLISLKFLITYSTKPFHVFAALGFTILGIGFLASLFVALRRFLLQVPILDQMPFVLFAIIMLTTAINLICFGFIAEMQSFEALSSGKRKPYIVEKIMN
jgi:glycosyltransferase involved in cell wall biosynthesis